MRLWAEERKSGTIELLMTLPISPAEAVIGKWLAGSIFLGAALLCTAPMWITVNLLGRPDNGVIAASYLGSFLLASAFLAIGACLSALTRNQVIAFILASAVSFLFVMSGTPVVLGAVQSFAPEIVVSAIAALSALTHYDAITRGVVDLRDLLYLASLIAFWLFANALIVEMKKAD
jgi:ABC-2 type transport system permease protein